MTDQQAVDLERLKFGPGEYTTTEMLAWLKSDTSVIQGTDMAAALIARLERAERIESAAREMLEFGNHEGPCDGPFEGHPCRLHQETFGRRRAALASALEAKP